MVITSRKLGYRKRTELLLRVEHYFSLAFFFFEEEKEEEE
jgi:hypothetical protein